MTSSELSNQSQLLGNVNEYRKWLKSNRERFPEAILVQWHGDLDLIEQLLQHQKELPIALLGHSQHGKSSLINAILGQPLLPVGGAVGACTSVPTSIHHASIDLYRAEIYFIGLDVWRKDIVELRDNLKSPPAHNESQENHNEYFHQVEVASERVRVAYNCESVEEFDFNVIESSDCGLPSHTVDLLKDSSPLVLEHREARELQKQIRPYTTTLERGTQSYWPLVSEIRITGNFPPLENGVSLTDLPGLDDPNPARERVTRNYFLDTRYLWLVCHSQNGITSVIRSMLDKNRLLLNLFVEGRLPSFSIVATYADDFNLDSVLEQMGKSEGDSEWTMPQIITFRREAVANEILSQISKIAESIIKKSPPSPHSSEFLESVRQIPIFVVGTGSYLQDIGVNRYFKGLKLSREESEIPTLIQHLKNYNLDNSVKERLDASYKIIQSIYDDITQIVNDPPPVVNNTEEKPRTLYISCCDEIEKSKKNISIYLGTVKAEIDGKISDFCEDLPRVQTSAQNELQRIVERWETICDWRSIVSAVRQEGKWNSRAVSIHFSQDITLAFTEQIAVNWDRLFEGHLKRSIESFSRECILEAERLSHFVKGKLSSLDSGELATITSIETSKQVCLLKSKSILTQAKQELDDARLKACSSLYDTVHNIMKPSYLSASQVASGTGVKSRIIAILKNDILKIAPHIFPGISAELNNSLQILQTCLKTRLDSISSPVLDLTKRLEANLTRL